MRSRILMTLVVFCCAGSAIGGPGVAKPQGGPEQAWKAEWRNTRNEIMLTSREKGVVYDPTSLMVKLTTAERGAAANQALFAAVGGQVIETWDLVPGLYHITTTMSVPDAIRTLRAQGGAAVEFAEPDYFVNALLTPNDTYFTRLWGMNNTGQTVKAQSAPTTTTSTRRRLGTSPRVARRL